MVRILDRVGRTLNLFYHVKNCVCAFILLSLPREEGALGRALLKLEAKTWA